ncbi:MAG: L-threonylcarbamoyladenylate synthase [Rubrobacter sp.]|jgi:L-threonylcarbamoyladenylate synthase|nr:L-threonylcarbamoyladenylate synthase [Rubrobacter sp.]
MKTVSPQKAADVIREGGVVLVPTETVVGLVCAEAGLEKVRNIKGRDAGKPIALLCRDAEEAFDFAGDVPPLARRLAEENWPGPLTLVLRAKGGGSVGIRVPEGKVREVLEAYGGSLYATSANPSGEDAPMSLEEVDGRVKGAVGAIVSGEGGNGEASAVVDLSGDSPRLLRSGGVFTEEGLRELAAEYGRKRADG